MFRYIYDGCAGAGTTAGAIEAAREGGRIVQVGMGVTEASSTCTC